MKQLRLCVRKRKLHAISILLILIGLFIVHPEMKDPLLKSVEMVSYNSTSSSIQLERFNSSNLYTMMEAELSEPDIKYTEPVYKEPVDLVYLWANGSDPKFVLDLKRQKALEDEKLYKSHLVCSKSYGSNVSIPVIVVYPAMPQPNKSKGNDKVKFIFNVTDKELTYTVIIPTNGTKAGDITNILTKIDGQTYMSLCGYITNKVNPLAKKTMETMYLVHSKNNQLFNNISENLKQVDVILQHEVNKGKDKYALIYDNSNNVPENRVNYLKQYGFETESAILVWDPHNKEGREYYEVKESNNIPIKVTKNEKERNIDTMCDIALTGQPKRNRFEDNAQLLYSLRSVEKYASWIQHIFIITNNQVPSWLNISNPRVSVISTEEIFPNKNDLPSFSSPAIESHMHRIPELAETFLFMCDDFFFGKPIKLSDFYTAKEGLKMFWDGRLSNCSPGCTHADLGNGKCDKKCDNPKCGWDYEDCRPIQHENLKLRHLVGVWYGSLFHTMAMFNRKFNHSKVYQMPPHVPLLVNKKVANDLEKSFHGEFEKSSALHFRSQFNIQYTMAYYEFVSSARVVMTTGELFYKLDENKSRILSCEELEKFRAMQRAGEVSLDVIALNQTDCRSEILKGDYVLNDTSRVKEVNMTKFQVSKMEFARCKCIIDALKRAKITRPKYKHKAVTTKERNFIMINSSLQRAQRDFSKVLHQPRKFNAVNDDMDHSKKETIAVKKALKQFYEKLFPKPSQFELVES